MNPWPEIDGKLEQTFRFKNYDEVRRFTNAVMEIADQQNHHPDIGFIEAKGPWLSTRYVPQVS